MMWPTLIAISGLLQTGSALIADCSSLDGWTKTGNCWSKAIVPSKLYSRQFQNAPNGYFLCTGMSGNAGIGTAEFSFKIEQPYINFSIAGGDQGGVTSVNLVVDGRVVATATGKRDMSFRPVTWETGQFLGKSAQLQILDRATGEFGFIALGGATQSAIPVDPSYSGHEGVGLPAQLRSFLENYRVANGIPGMAVVVYRRGVPILQGGFGTSHPAEPQRKFTPDTLCRIGSISKPLTAMGVARLLELGQLHLSDPAIRWFPQALRDAALQGDSRWSRVTIEDLLLHQSGLGGEFSDVLFCRGADAQRELKLKSPAAGLDLLCWGIRRPLSYAPGTRNEYSNFGFALLARVIETCSRTPYEEFMKRNIFDPLGAKSFSIGHYKPDELLPSEARYLSGDNSHPFWQAERLVDNSYCWDLTTADGAGGWICDALDLAKVLDAFYACKILSLSTMDYVFAELPGKTSVRAAWAVGRGSTGDISVFNYLGVVMGGSFGFAECKGGYTMCVLANHCPKNIRVWDFEGPISKALGI